jgi:hypothetical protein
MYGRLVCLLTLALLLVTTVPSVSAYSYTSFSNTLNHQIGPSLGSNTDKNVTNTNATDIMSPILTSWQKTMHRTSPPSIGCFNATFPSTKWVEEPCQSAGNYSADIGANQYPDFYTSGGGKIISSAEGQFTSETNFQAENQANFPAFANLYSIQLNTNTYSTTFHGNSVDAWEQFNFYTPNCCSTTDYVQIEYVLLNYQNTYGSS